MPSQWFSWKNVALNIHAEVAPYTADAVKTFIKLLSEMVDARLLQKDRSIRLKHFVYAK